MTGVSLAAVEDPTTAKLMVDGTRCGMAIVARHLSVRHRGARRRAVDSRRLGIGPLCLVVACLGSAQPSAQDQTDSAATHKFEVASVKESLAGGNEHRWYWPPGRFEITNMTLGNLIALAYGEDPLTVRTFERLFIRGGSAELLRTRFDIRATAAAGVSPRRYPAMLQTLLQDRFGLRVRRETREGQIYSATLRRSGQLGPELRASKHDCHARLQALNEPGATDLPMPHDAKGLPICGRDPANPLAERYAGPLPVLFRRVQGFTDRPIVDATGLSGNFEWSLVFSRMSQPNPLSAFAPPQGFAAVQGDAGSLHQALEEQLGLKLGPRNGPIELLVIDSVEPPKPD